MKTIISIIALAFFGTQALAANVIHRARGEASFYYDVHGPGTCGKIIGVNNFDYMLVNPPSCEPIYPHAKPLKTYNTNNIVAIPSKMLTGIPNRHKYCGKRIVVTINGKRRDDLKLVVWDACVGCNSHGGLDFSSTTFGDLFGVKGCGRGRIKNELAWEILDEDLMHFVQKY